MNLYKNQWLNLFKMGDIFIIIVSLFLIYFSFDRLWINQYQPDFVIIRVKNLPPRIEYLNQSKLIEVQGNLGKSIIEIDSIHQRVRIQKDPSPKQLCVIRGWLTLSRENAICLPNQVSIELASQFDLNQHYDSKSY